MNPETQLALQYELALLVGRPLPLQELLDKVLDTVIQQSGSAAGAILFDPREDGSVELLAVLGDPVLAAQCGQRCPLSQAFTPGQAQVRFFESAEQPGELSHYRRILQVTVDMRCALLLLDPAEQQDGLALGRCFHAGLLNLGGAIALRRERDLATTHQLREQNQFAMDRVGIGIHWVEASSGRILYANQAAAEMLGYRSDEFLGFNIEDIDPGLAPGDFPKVTADYPQSGKTSFDTFLRHKDGHLIPVNVTLYHRPATALEGGCFISFIRDISEIKRAEDFLRQAKEAAESATLAKSAFLANMSHEIRTPLNAIIGCAYLMRRHGIPPEHGRMLQRIETSGQHLLAVINDILDLSKIEAGQFELVEAPLHIEQLVNEVSQIISAQAEAKGLSIRLELDKLDGRFLGDATRLKQSLLNYANNALKFSERGGIVIRVRRESSEREHSLLRFEVEDSGIGIAPDILSRLFVPFEQGDCSSTRRHGGTGLGLAITKTFAELMGGTAGARSRPGQGSTFWFTARLRPAADSSAAPVTLRQAADRSLAERHAGRRILLVEDDPVNREIGKFLLNDVGLHVEMAEDGLLAVEKIRARSYDLVLMDMQMPGLDGPAATQRIRALPHGEKLPIIAMTANVFADDRERCLAAGMDDFVSKPVAPELLYACLLEWLDKGGGPER